MSLNLEARAAVLLVQHDSADSAHTGLLPSVGIHFFTILTLRSGYKIRYISTPCTVIREYICSNTVVSLHVVKAGLLDQLTRSHNYLSSISQ